MTLDPVKLPPSALAGLRIGVSVSDSADLARLGLSPKHLDLVMAETARAILLAGGTLVYGGNLSPTGFTYILLEEARRFASEREAVEFYIPLSEHMSASVDEINSLEKDIGLCGRLHLMTGDGIPQTPAQQRRSTEKDETPAAEALSAMRKTTAATSDARLLLGGKLSGYAGAEPGIVEEARYTLEAGKPLLLAGGYGGAAGALCIGLGICDSEWLPEGCPADADQEKIGEMVGSLRTKYEQLRDDDGLSSPERSTLARSHRPSDIATLTVLGLSRRAHRQK